MQDFYTILKLASNASEEDIRKAIHRELRSWSTRTNAPDINRRQEAEQMVKALEEAERILLDPTKRAEYDRKLRTTPQPQRQIDEQEVTGQKDVLAMGWALLIQGNVPDALYVATLALEQQPKNPEAWAFSAEAKSRWGETDDAIADYRQAIRLRPNEATYYFEIGRLYDGKEMWKEALDNYEKAARIKSDVPMYRAAVGSVLLRFAMYDKAIALLEKCVAEAPDNDAFNWLLAIAYHDMVLKEWYHPQSIDIHYESSSYCNRGKETAIKSVHYLSKAMALKFHNVETRKLLQEHLDAAIWATEKHWKYELGETFKFGLIVGSIGILTIYLFGLIVESIGILLTICFYGLGLLLLGGWIYLSFQPGWKLSIILHEQFWRSYHKKHRNR